MNMEQLQTRLPGIIHFVDRRCFPEWKIERDIIQFHDLTFVVEGKSNYYVNGVKYTVEAGDVIYIPLGSEREAHTIKETPMHSYAFNFNWLPMGSPDALPLDTVTKNIITSEMLNYIRQFNQVWAGRQPGYIMQSRALFMLIMHQVMTIYYRKEAEVRSDKRISQVLEYVMEHYSEELNLTKIARIVNLHPAYLGKLFKINTGCSFKEYLNQIRVNHAEMLLSTGGFSVTGVAERCGFHDISYFSNVFKSIKGYPPSAVRK
ncbi:AraC-like DNA-binding protein [Paenibacillus sp. OAS669]|nr:AraC-like DNA-binding protein [Paenibacillus sp. OAS669]